MPCFHALLRSVVLVLTAAVLAPATGFAKEPSPTNRTAPQPVGEMIYLDQGWSDALRQKFYYTPQGSRMMPLSWFLALETKDGRSFADPAQLTKYGLLPPDGASTLNPHNLSVGLAIDPVDVPGLGKHIGLTCAACHTGNVNVGGKTVRVSGTASNFDFDSFYRDLAKTVSDTRFDEARLRRFIGKVTKDVPAEARAEASQKLLGAFTAFTTKITADAIVRNPTVESGFGRVDALTQIFNALGVNGQGNWTNLHPVRAPVAYPHLWLTPQYDFVQWNPIASNAIGRNGGQVLGVFADTQLANGTPKKQQFRSSMIIDNLHQLERWVAILRPPVWDESIFGPIDQARAKRGADIYRQNCQSCHAAPPYKRTDPTNNIAGISFIEINAVPIGKVATDTLYLRNAGARNIFTNDVTQALFGGRSVVPMAEYAIGVAAKIVINEMEEKGYGPRKQAELSGFRLTKDGGRLAKPCEGGSGCYKAGPLTGVWASGPYLHNGSVPTVYELLSPVSERRSVFWMGGRQLDAKRLGFKSENGPGRFKFDTAIDGNRNTGHLFPPRGLTPDERLDVIEYLKTLGSLDGAAGTIGAAR
ncbi:MAG: cytochrome c [Pseudomonadota bacterium]